MLINTTRAAKTILGIALCVFVYTLLTNGLAYAASSTIAPAGTYTSIYLSGNDLTSLTNDTTINNVPNLGNVGYFWSHQFDFTSAPKDGGAYIGLQGINKAIFSVFDWPSPETSSICKTYQDGFDGGAYNFGGTSCLINYSLSEGYTYRITVSKIGQNSHGNIWQGSVTDLMTNQTTIIADINIPASWGNIANSSIVWTEYFPANTNPIKSCSAVPPSDVTFSNFTGSSGSSTYGITSHTDNITSNACAGSSLITVNGSDSFTQIMGGKPTQTTPPAQASSAKNNDTKTTDKAAAVNNPKAQTSGPQISKVVVSPNKTTSDDTPVKSVKNSPQTSSPKTIQTTSAATTSESGTTSNTSNTHACNKGGSAFLLLPTWYEYLTCNSEGSPQITSISDIWLIVAAIIEILLRLAGLIAVCMIIYSGIQYTTSTGEPEQTHKALSTIISAAIGLVICIISAGIVTFIAGSFT